MGDEQCQLKFEHCHIKLIDFNQINVYKTVIAKTFTQSGEEKVSLKSGDFWILNLKPYLRKIECSTTPADSDDFVDVFVDGACRNNVQEETQGGCGVYWSEENPLNAREYLTG